MSINRPLKPALLRGWRRCCPRCGKGALLYKYLKVHDRCDSCGQELHHQRADDGPAYLTILIVGHILAPLVACGICAVPPRAMDHGTGLWGRVRGALPLPAPAHQGRGRCVSMGAPTKWVWSGRLWQCAQNPARLGL